MRLKRGFSILELSVVLVIIGMVIAASTVMFTASLKQQQFKDTQMKMQAIQKALLDFRRAYDRLPCPADIVIPISNSIYYGPNGLVFGAEAELWYNTHITNSPGCYDVTNPYDYKPSANFVEDRDSGIGTDNSGDGGYTANQKVVGGMVPTRTLGLPDDYAFDGWGRRIRYIVDMTATSPSITRRIPLPDTTTSWGTSRRIMIFDYDDNQKQAMALYVLISHGPNGHGGFGRAVAGTDLFGASGNPVNAGVTNSQELLNCNCDPTYAFQPGYPTASTTETSLYQSGYIGGYMGTFDTHSNPLYNLGNFSDNLDDGPTFVQGQIRPDATDPSGANDFDDIVYYATRADLPGYNE